MTIMSSFLIGGLVLASFLVINIFLRLISGRSSKNLPPGPRPLPIIGNILHLGEKPHRSLAKLAETYGPLMTLQLGQVTTIVATSSEIAKEILQKHDTNFCNRNVVEAVRAHDHFEHATAWLPAAAKWRGKRKITGSYLFTAQKLDSQEEVRRQKIQELVQDIEECRRVGKAVDIGQAAFKTTFNLLSNTFLSMDLSGSGSNAAREMRETLRVIVEETGKPNLADYFPVLSIFDPQGIRRRMTAMFGKLFVLSDKIIAERAQMRKENGGSGVKNDMLDTLLDLSEGGDADLDADGIKHMVMELFGAGNDTTSTTMEWGMTELMQNPKVLSKASQEIRETLGKGNLIQESDISRLPYLQAVVKETLRLHPPVPFLIPRKSGSDVEINGFTVPKDAQILVNAWAIGRDPKVWENPESFMPERFLTDSHKDFRGGDFEFVPFGGGRRICPGLPLGIRMLHLVIGSLVQSFDWKLDGGKTDMEEKFGITLQKARRLIAIPEIPPSFSD